MLDLEAVAYSSKATRQLSAHDLDGLLMDARSFNERWNVSGALLYQDGTFFQYFEGSPDSMRLVYARIKRSTMHHHLVELLNQPTDVRQFQHWHMAFAEPAPTMVQQISNEVWAMTLPTLHRKQKNSPGLALLLDYWDSAQREDTANA